MDFQDEVALKNCTTTFLLVLLFGGSLQNYCHEQYIYGCSTITLTTTREWVPDIIQTFPNIAYQDLKKKILREEIFEAKS